MKKIKYIFSVFVLALMSSFTLAQNCYIADIGQPVVVFTNSIDHAIGDAEFSVSETKKVHFAKGNLMYKPSTKTWRIAPRQYDFVGGDNKRDNEPYGRQGTIWENGVQCDGTSRNHVRNYTGWLDVFTWGASGWYGDDPGEDDLKTYTWRLANNPNQKITCNPYDLGHKDSLCLILGGDPYQGMTGAYANADWGIRNNIALGGSVDSVFRTPTKEEFDYLLSKRENAKDLSLRGHIRLNGNGGAPDTIINGLILLPDDWDPAILPEKTLISDEDGNEYYVTNELSAAEWQILEENGAIFLPATGNTSKFNRSGFYWTSTSWKDLSAYNVEFGGYGWNGHASDPQTKAADKSSGRAVRLVMEITTREIIETPIVTPSCSHYETYYTPSDKGGYIEYHHDNEDECLWHLKAHTNPGYKFAYWTGLHGEKEYIDTTDVNIDLEHLSIVMQATFIKSNPYMHELTDTCIAYRADTSDIFNGSISGSADIFVDGDVLHMDMNKLDYGIWKHTVSSELRNNKYAGKNAHIVFFNECHKPSGTFDTIIPYIVCGDSVTKMVYNADVQVFNNASLMINNNTVIDGFLNIHAGGKVIVQDGKTLEVNGIIMHGNGIDRKWPQLIVDGNIINHNNDTIYYDYALDYNEYYPLALPYTTKCASVHNPINKRSASYQSYTYNSEIRATGVSGWQEFDDTEIDAEFAQGKGYIIYAVPMKWKGNRQRTAIMRFPMKANLNAGEPEKSVNIFYSEGSGKICDKNWNLIGNPYLSEFRVSVTDSSKLLQGYYDYNDLTNEYELKYLDSNPAVRYITYSNDGFRTYNQERLSNFIMKPFNSYFTQTIGGSSITFAKSDRANNAPRRMNMSNNKSDNTELDIEILIMQGSDKDNAGLTFGDYTDDYELNADLIKEFGESKKLSLYSLQMSNNDLLSYQAISYDYFDRAIPIGYRNAKIGEPIIFSLDDTFDIMNIESIWLIDNMTRMHTNLIKEDYMFIPDNSEDNNRFYISVCKKSNQNDIATSITDIENDINIKVYNIFGYEISPNQIQPYNLYIKMNNKGKAWKEIIKK